MLGFSNATSFILKGMIFEHKGWGIIVKPTDEGNSFKLEELVELINAEQTEEATATFMKLVGAICDEPVTDKILKELVKF